MSKSVKRLMPENCSRTKCFKNSKSFKDFRRKRLNAIKTMLLELSATLLRLLKSWLNKLLMKKQLLILQPKRLLERLTKQNRKKLIARGKKLKS